MIKKDKDEILRFTQNDTIYYPSTRISPARYMYLLNIDLEARNHFFQEGSGVSSKKTDGKNDTLDPQFRN